MDVTDILRDRMQKPAGLQRMVGRLGCARIVAARGRADLRAAAAAARSAAEPPRTVMTISLGGGGDGPRQRRHDVDGRPAGAGADAARGAAKREPVRPPAAKTPEMTVPLPDARPTQADAGADGEAGARRGARPDADAGRRRRAGQRDAETRRARPGLRAVDRRRSGHRLVARRRRLLLSRLHRDDGRAHPQAWKQQPGRAGADVVKFTIQRDGTLTDAEVEKSSGIADARPRGAARGRVDANSCRRCRTRFRIRR